MWSNVQQRPTACRYSQAISQLIGLKVGSKSSKMNGKKGERERHYQRVNKFLRVFSSIYCVHSPATKILNPFGFSFYFISCHFLFADSALNPIINLKIRLYIVHQTTTWVSDRSTRKQLIVVGTPENDKRSSPLEVVYNPTAIVHRTQNEEIPNKRHTHIYIYIETPEPTRIQLSTIQM